MQTAPPEPARPRWGAGAVLSNAFPLGRALCLRGRVRVVPFQKVSL